MPPPSATPHPAPPHTETRNGYMPHGAGKWQETLYEPRAKALMQKQAKQNHHQAKGNRALFSTRQKPPRRPNKSIMQIKQKPNDV